MALGYRMRAGLDCTEVFGPTVRFVTLRVLMAMVAEEDLEMHEMDVSDVFLNGAMDEEVFMSQPEGFIKNSEEGLVCKLNKALHGTKHATHKAIDKTLQEQGYSRSFEDYGLYHRWTGEDRVLLAIYVDDNTVVGKQ